MCRHGPDLPPESSLILQDPCRANEPGQVEGGVGSARCCRWDPESRIDAPLSAMPTWCGSTEGCYPGTLPRSCGGVTEAREVHSFSMSRWKRACAGMSSSSHPFLFRPLRDEDWRRVSVTPISVHRAIGPQRASEERLFGGGATPHGCRIPKPMTLHNVDYGRYVRRDWAMRYHR
jgi:hypothetical protein